MYKAYITMQMDDNMLELGDLAINDAFHSTN